MLIFSGVLKYFEIHSLVTFEKSSNAHEEHQQKNFKSQNLNLETKNDKNIYRDEIRPKKIKII